MASSLPIWVARSSRGTDVFTLPNSRAANSWVADAVAEKVTEGEGEGGEAEGEEAKEEAGGEEKAEEPPAEIAAKSIPISAKLKGIGLKVFRSGPPPVPGAAPAADPKVQEAKTKAEDLTNRLRTAFAGGSKGSSSELAALLMAPDVTQLVRANCSERFHAHRARDATVFTRRRGAQTTEAGSD